MNQLWPGFLGALLAICGGRLGRVIALSRVRFLVGPGTVAVAELWAGRRLWS
ncbi:hypothetical protein [Micromonospora sp. NBC_01412]|uniref:hypothetical protein n=1 Tax=Micromonospora sp. NBC_01412 TaxID=2903590 RepID=UPI00324EA650